MLRMASDQLGLPGCLRINMQQKAGDQYSVCELRCSGAGSDRGC